VTHPNAREPSNHKTYGGSGPTTQDAPEYWRQQKKQERDNLKVKEQAVSSTLGIRKLPRHPFNAVRYA
jgi:hypothetical protein